MGTETVAVFTTGGAAGAGADFAIRGAATVAVETDGAAGAGRVTFGTETVAVFITGGATGAGAGTGFAFSLGMDTVFVGAAFSPSSVV